MISVDVSKFINYQAISNITSWKNLVEHIHKLEQDNPNEIIQVSLVHTPLNTVNDYIKELIIDNRVQFLCIKNNITWKVLSTTAAFLLRNNNLSDKFNLIELNTTQTLSKKELAAQAQYKKYNAAIEAALSKTKGPAVFVSYLDLTKDCGLNNLCYDCKELPTFFKQFCDYCKNAEKQQVIISLRNVKYNPNLIDAACKAAIQWFADAGIELIFSDCDANLAGKLKLYRKMTYSNGTIEDAVAFIEDLGLGRVVLLTKLKSHRSTNTRYREKDEVVAQFIGIISQITPADVTFRYAGFGQLTSFHDLLAQYGAPDEFETLIMNTITINYANLGITSLRIADKWHLNLFDGAAKGSSEFNYVDTYTSENIRSLPKPERVILPEFLRRSLKSWNISFNEQALLADIKNFQKTLKK